MPQYQSDPSALSRVYVPGHRRRAGAAELGGASIERRTAPLAVNHQDQFPSVTISFNLAPGAALSDAVAAITTASARSACRHPSPAATRATPTSSPSRSRGQPWLILAAIITIYIVLGVLYESFVHPFTILTTLPSAGIGALLALMLCGMDLSLIALIGIVLLMGIVKKNAIMMIDFALEAERTRGMSPRDSIVQACLLRFRPIMMTTLAALFGALPLAIESGTGSELRNPLGVTIIGGLLLCQLLTLYTTPVIYLAMERVRARLAPARPNGETPRARLDPPAEPPAARGVGHELLAPLHRAADRHHAAGAWACCCSALVAYRFLPVASLPSVEFPTIRVNASRPGADPETMAATRRRAARAPARRDRRRHRDDLGQLARLDAHLHPVRPQPRHRRRGARRAGRPQRGRRRPAGRPAHAAALPQVQPGRGADPDPGADLQDHRRRADIYDAADTVIAQRISQVDGVAEVQVAGAEQPAIRVRVNPMLLSSMGVSIEDVRTAIVNANAVAPLGIIDGDKQAIAHRDQRPAAQPRGLQDHRRQDGRTAMSCACRRWPTSSRPRATRARPRCSTASRPSC